VYSNIDSFSAYVKIFSIKLPNQIKIYRHSSLFSKLNTRSIYNICKHRGRFFSTSSETLDAALKDILPPFFITGLTDAEGSFTCVIKKNAAYKAG
jgi:hypothetical protein